MIHEKVIESLRTVFEDKYQDKLAQIKLGKDRLTVSYYDLVKQDPALGELYLEEEAEEFLRLGQLVIEEVTDKKNVAFRIKNVPEDVKVKIRNIRAKHLDKVIAVEGMINTISDVRPMVVSACFECPACNNKITLLQLNSKKFIKPSQCGCGRKGKFRILSKEYEDTQRMILEESTESLEGSEQPRKINIILTAGLTHPELDKKNTPGSKVLVIGILKERAKIIQGEESVDREYFLMANHIEPLEYGYKDINLTKEDIEEVKKLAENKNILDLMVKSYSPDIYGHSIVKKAIVLQIFGGNSVRDTNGKLIRRGEFNILLVGDSGVAKTKMVKYSGKIAPKFRYSSGTGASGVGLTASVQRDDFIGGWCLVGGVLVLANGGLAVLDELDKIDKDERGKLHEAMSENSITITKASIRATLKAETAILAAANPKFGRFDFNDTLASQIDLGASLLSRFDFIYPIVDEVNHERDEKIIKMMLKVASGDKEIVSPPILPELFTKYITYAKANIKPKFTNEAKEALVKIYLSFREMGSHSQGNKIAITPRYGEALVRLSQATAKAHLSKKILVEHVEIAKEVLWYSLEKLAIDPETGKLDVDRLTMSVTGSKRNLMKSILNEIYEYSKIHNTTKVDEQEIISKIKDIFDTSEQEIYTILDKLREEGEIFYPSKGKISILK